MKTIKGYKFIQKDMKSKNGNHKWKIGKWYKYDGELELCRAGFHACRQPLESLEYVYGDRWFIVEARGKIVELFGDLPRIEFFAREEVDGWDNWGNETNKLNSEKAEKTCATKHVIPPKSKDSGILPNFT